MPSHVCVNNFKSVTAETVNWERAKKALSANEDLYTNVLTVLRKVVASFSGQMSS